MVITHLHKISAILKDSSLALRWSPIRLKYNLRWPKTSWEIFTHVTQHERLLLYRLGLKQSRSAVMVEVGSYLGASANFLAAAASEIGGAAKVHCVDTWQNQGMAEGVRDTWAEFRKNTESYGEIIVPHRGLSVDISKSFSENIDLLFLDGDHSYEGCRSDAEAWLPYMKHGGYLVMHDYGWAEGVQRVVHEIVKPRESMAGKVMENTYWTRI